MTPSEPDLNFIARELANLISEVRSLRDEVRALRSIRDEVVLLREEARITGITVRLLEDAITNNVMDRLQALENSRKDD